jgi:hypothetical protein
MSNSIVISQLIQNEQPKSKTVEFVYNKEGEINWRKINLSFEDSNLIKGFDLEDGNKFKSFKKKFIIGQRLIEVKS